ncbi:uncharacterized protein [Mytilus edulis]|uniref:uncharacterized protein n=1 Tax=Mytilus edulis TaxID=6550 RepID=UPI0039F06C09
MKLVKSPIAVMTFCRFRLLSLSPITHYNHMTNLARFSKIHCSTQTSRTYTCVTIGNLSSNLFESCHVKKCGRIEDKQYFHQCGPNLNKKFPKKVKIHDNKKGQSSDESNNVKRVKLVKLIDTIQLFSNEDLLIGKQTLAGAKEYANSKGFKLAKLEGKFTEGFPSYKLVTKEEQKEEQKKTPKEKSPKRFDIETKIAGHDLQIKINQMVKILVKGRKVNTVLSAAKNEQNKGLLGSVHKEITEGLDSVGYIKDSKFNIDKGYINSVYVPRENKVKTADGTSEDDGDKKE